MNTEQKPLGAKCNDYVHIKSFVTKYSTTLNHRLFKSTALIALNCHLSPEFETFMMMVFVTFEKGENSNDIMMVKVLLLQFMIISVEIVDR